MSCNGSFLTAACPWTAPAPRAASRLGPRSDRVAVYPGGLYGHEGIPSLLTAWDRTRARVPDFQVVVFGDGRERSQVARAAALRRWIHPVGARLGAGRVPCLVGARVPLKPGAVGLVILDSFVRGIPMVSTDRPDHGSGIAYPASTPR